MMQPPETRVPAISLDRRRRRLLAGAVLGLSLALLAAGSVLAVPAVAAPPSGAAAALRASSRGASAMGAVVVAPAPSAGAAAAAPAQRPVRANLDEYPKIDPKDLAEKYQTFLSEVDVIITKDEKDVFLRLETDAKRDAYIERFWRVRDPTVGTPQNEYKDEYYRRLEYVEKHYGRDTPRLGRQTDRGRMYLLLGEPMNVKAMPWTQLAYPAEIWWYHANPKLGIPPFFYLVFFKRQGVGEFRLYSPLVDGPTALLNPAGMEAVRSLQTQENGRPSTGEGEVGAAYDILTEVDAELAQVSLSLIPGDYGAQVGYGSMQSQMMMGEIESIPDVIMPSASWAYPVLTGVVEADVRFESLPIRSMAVALLDPSGIPFLHYGVMTDGGRLNLATYEDKYYLTFQVAGSLTDDQNRVVAAVSAEDGSSKILQADLDEAEARRLRSGPLVYLDRLPVVQGDFDFDLVLENNVSREYGRSKLRVDVPAPWPAYLRSAPPILAWAVLQNADYDPYGEHYPFQVGGYGIVPSLDYSFDVADGISVFQQIYLPHGDVPSRLSAHYTLSKDDATVIDRTEYIDTADADHNGVIDHAGAIDLEGVAPGEYELVVDIDDDDRPAATFTVTVTDHSGATEDWTPHLHMNLGPPPTDARFAYERAQEFRTLGETDKAIEALSSATSRVNDPEILDLQVDLLMEAGRYADVDALLRPRLVKDPNNVTLLQALAEASSQMGRNFEAIRYYERIRLTEGEERTSILNPLASAYYGEGNRAKAREMLELSLRLDPDQPEVRRLLDEVLGKGGG